MFTGIIQAIGKIKQIEAKQQDTRLLIAAGSLSLADTQVGDSIAVNGVCLTATEITGDSFWVDVSAESLDKTSLKDIKISSPVNLEKALTLSTPLGGHLVSGHVDGLGKILNISKSGRSTEYKIELPEGLAKYVASKGSVCIDGVSLTVNSINGCEFSISIIPHTQEQTIIKSYRVGTKLNIEIDLIARYMERLMLGEQAAKKVFPCLNLF